MKQTHLLQELRKMRFKGLYDDWFSGSLTQEEAARVLGVSDRTFRRYIKRYEEHGESGLSDRRIEQASNRCAPVDEVCSLETMYKTRFMGWNAKHFHSWYLREGGGRSYTWVKEHLQAKGLIKKAKGKGKHRKKRERSVLPGMMIHQDGSRHEWIDDYHWDLIVTMDDATNEHYSMFFVEEEGTASSFQGIRDVINQRGLFCSFYSDRGSHYWITPEAGGRVDKVNLTQFGRAMKQLGIEMIAAYSPEARGRSERMFSTHQERLPKELALMGIKSMEEANHYLKTVYMPRFNQEFCVKAAREGGAFVSYQGTGVNLDEILCEHYERQVGKDNCVQFMGMSLQIPEDSYRHHYVKVTVKVHSYSDASLAVFHGPRCLGRYGALGKLLLEEEEMAA